MEMKAARCGLFNWVTTISHALQDRVHFSPHSAGIDLSLKSGTVRVKIYLIIIKNMSSHIGI